MKNRIHLGSKLKFPTFLNILDVLDLFSLEEMNVSLISSQSHVKTNTINFFLLSL